MIDFISKIKLKRPSKSRSVFGWYVLVLSVLSAFILFTKTVQAAEEIKLIDLKDAKYVGTETCATCHEEEDKEFRLSTHARIKTSKDENVANGCEMCHGPGSIHADNGGGKTNIINPRKNPETCFACHMEKKAEFRLPYHHPVLEGKMSCVDCHKLVRGKLVASVH